MASLGNRGLNWISAYVCVRFVIGLINGPLPVQDKAIV